MHLYTPRHHWKLFSVVINSIQNNIEYYYIVLVGTDMFVWSVCCWFLTCVCSVMDQFIDEYVQETNKEIEHFNREVDLQPHVDLFDP